MSRADPAITRTSRFDARIFVAPPGLAVKRRELAHELGSVNVPEIDAEKVRAALAAPDDDRKDLTGAELALGALPLLRFDQVPELARRLRAAGSPASADTLQSALETMRGDLLHHEWQPADTPKEWAKMDEADQIRFVYREYLADQSRDFSRRRELRVSSGLDGVPTEWQEIDGPYRLPAGAEDRFFNAPDDLSAYVSGDGLLRLPGIEGDDRALLWFRPPTSDDNASPPGAPGAPTPATT